MPARMVVILVVLALGMAGAVWWLNRPAAVADLGPLLPGLELSKVRRVEIAWTADGTLSAVIEPAGADDVGAVKSTPANEKSSGDRLPSERGHWPVSGQASGVWVMRWREGTAERSWPIITSRVAGAMRLLGAVRATGVEPSSAMGAANASSSSITSSSNQVSPGESAAIRVHLADGTVTELRAESDAFGGGGRLRVGNGGVNSLVAEVDGELVRIFGRADVRAWRDPGVFVLETMDAARVEIDEVGDVVRLARVGPRWGVIEPTPAPGERSAIEGMLAALKKVRVARFGEESGGAAGRGGGGVARVEGGVEDDGGLAEGDVRTRVVIESDRRSPDGDASRRWVLRQELRIGPAGAEGQGEVVASVAASMVRADGVERRWWGPTRFFLDAATARELSKPAEAFVSRRAATTVAADVRGVRVRQASAVFEARRALAEWNGADSTPMEESRASAVREIIELVTGVTADRVELSVTRREGDEAHAGGRPSTGPREIATIELFGDGAWEKAGGEPIETIGVHDAGVASDLTADALGGGVIGGAIGSNEILLVSGSVTRVYLGESARRVREALAALK